MGQTAEELRDQLATQREDLGRDLEAIGDRVSPGRMVERRQAAMRRRFTDMRNALMGAADTATHVTTDSASSGASRVSDALTDAARGARTTAQGNPLAMGLVAFGAGLVAATLFPASSTERRLAGQAQPTLEHAAEQVGPKAKEMVGEMRDELQPAAKGAVSEVGETAKQAADTVKEDAAQAAKGTATETARSAQAARDDLTKG
ncbi:MAG TPA: DUF3618 domain-containing protein [Acidimicrobiales bacterium]